MVAYSSCRRSGRASGRGKATPKGLGKGEKGAENEKKILNSGNEPKDLFKRKELAFFWAKNELVFDAKEPKSNPKMGPKNRLLRGIEVKFASRKASADRRAQGGYTSIGFDVARHWKSAEG